MPAWGTSWGGDTDTGALRSRLAAQVHSLPRQFWLLAAGTFVYLVGVEMCYPFETIYLDKVMGVSSTTIGLIIGVAMIGTLPVQMMGGAFCDRFGRRTLLIVAMAGSMTLYVGLGLARELWIVVALLVLEAALGWAQFITASNAMIADLMPYERRAEAFSISRVALNSGITVGPLLAAPLILLDPSFRVSFIVGGLICGVVLVMIATLFKETRPVDVGRETLRATFAGFGTVARDRRMVTFCLVAVLPLYGFGQVWVTLPIMLGDLRDVSPQEWSILLVVYGTATAVLQYPVVRLLGRRDHMALLAVSSASIGLGLGAAAFVPWPATVACVLVLSFGIVLFAPISSTVVAHIAPAALRGRYMGVWTVAYMGGYALGPLLGGLTLDALGGRGAFAVSAGIGVLGAVLFLALRGVGAFGRDGSSPRPAQSRR